MDFLYAVCISPIEAILHLVLSISYSATGHYGASLIMLSLFVNLALLPIYHIAETWQQAERDMQNRLRPKLQEFKEAFSGEERFMMVRTLYRQAGYHPMYAVRGSVGFLIQVPVFLAAYHLLSHYPPMNGVPAFIFKDLSQPDALLGGINVMPFVMTFVNLLSTYVYAKNLRRADIIQLWVISLVFLILLYGSAVALLFYWTFNNVFSLLKNMVYARFALSPAASVWQGAEGRGKLARLIAPSTTFSLVMFLVVVAVQAIVPMGVLPSVGRELDNNFMGTVLTIGVSIVSLAYLCTAFSWKASLVARAVAPSAGFRQEANIALVWMLFAMFVVVNGAWLSKIYSELPYVKLVGGILFLLAFALFSSPVCGKVWLVREMPDDHSLYVLSTSLLAFAVFIANPMSFYVHSGDFSGGVFHDVAGKLLTYCVVAVLACTSLYFLADNPVRKCLTLLSVVFVLSVIVYSFIGVKNVGLMVHFKLFHRELLVRTGLEILTEVGLLLALFGLTTYVIIHHRQSVTRVVGAMLLASLCVAAVDAYEGNAKVIAEQHGLPVNHQDIIGFSRERNVLLILLDGFSGGYIQTIMNEAPDTLKDYEGFVWYPNMLTTNAGTLGSIATLAGGHKYTVQQINNGNYGSIGNAIKEAYTVYPDAFIPKEYQVSYVYPYYNNGCEGIDRRVLCTDTVPYGIYYHDKEEPDAPLLRDSYSHLPPILSMVSVFKASPFFLKGWIYGWGNFQGALPATIRIRQTNSFKVKDWGFLRVLAHESNADSKSKTFKFVHLEIPHEPYAFSDDCRLLPSRATVGTEMVCALKEIGVLLSWLKKNGIYDVTKIVVVSDHGWWVDNPMFPPDFSQTVPKGNRSQAEPGWVQSLLLVKDFGAKGNMIRSDTFLSNPDVPSIICAAIEGCRDVGPDPTTNNLGDRVLTFTNSTWDNGKEEGSSSFNVTEGYEVRNNMFDVRNWRRIK